MYDQQWGSPPKGPANEDGRNSAVGVSLSKGGNVSLSKEAPGLPAVTVGLGWDVRSTTGTDFDLDASAIACTAAGKVLSDHHSTFFHNLQRPRGDPQDRLPGLDLRRRQPPAELRAGPQRLHPRREPGRRHRDRSLRPL